MTRDTDNQPRNSAPLEQLAARQNAPSAPPSLKSRATRQAASLKSESIFTPGFLRVLVVQMTFGCAYSAFLLLPKYLRTELSASATEIGLVMGIALVVAAVASPFVGLSARLVQRRSLLAVALVAEAIGGIGFVFVDEIGPLMLVLRALQGFAWVVVFNCTATIAADMVPPGRLSQAIGFLGISMLVTNALAPAVVEPAAERFGWGPVFGVPAIVALLSLAIVPTLKEPHLAGDKSAAQSIRQTGGAKLLSLYYVSFLMGCGIAVMFTFTQPYALSQGATMVGEFFLGYVASALVVRIGLSWVADRAGAGRVAVYSTVGYSLVVAAAAGLTPGTLMLVGAGLGVSHGFLYPALVAAGMSKLNATERTLFMGFVAGSFNAGFAVCALGLGVIADRFGYASIFVIVALLLASGVPPLAISQGLVPNPFRRSRPVAPPPSAAWRQG